MDNEFTRVRLEFRRGSITKQKPNPRLFRTFQLPWRTLPKKWIRFGQNSKFLPWFSPAETVIIEDLKESEDDSADEEKIKIPTLWYFHFPPIPLGKSSNELNSFRKYS